MNQLPETPTKLRNLGAKTIQEIEDLLNEYGI